MNKFEDTASIAMPAEFADNLRTLNSWWAGKPGPVLPAFRRWPFERLRSLIKSGLAPATVLRGPRRVGKTVLMRQLIEAFLAEGVDARHILYVSFDELPTLEDFREPVLAIARWYEANILHSTFNAEAHAGRTCLLFFDEVQNLDAWAPQIKNLVDNHTVRALLTGSSSFRIEVGKDSLAGRITTVVLGPMLLREIAALRFGQSSQPFWNGKDLDGMVRPDFWKDAVSHSARNTEIRRLAFSAFSSRGGYPFAHERPDIPWPELADQLNEMVINRAIQHDLRVGGRGQKRDQRLLEEVFRLCCRYAGQTPGPSVMVPDVSQALAASVGWLRILNYLRFLDATLLVRLIEPMELRLKRRKSPDKVCLCDHSLRASWTQEVIPLAQEELEANPHLTDLAGHMAESTLGYFLSTVPNLDVAYFPSRGIEPEVDFVVTVGLRRIPVEVKYRRRIDAFEDTRGLRTFLEKTAYNAPFGLLVTLADGVSVPDPRIIPISLSALLWLR